jgi:hypothetical protein
MGLSQIPGELKKEISPDISSSKKKGMLSFLDSRHAPFWPLTFTSNDAILSFHRLLTPPPHRGGGVLSSNMKTKLLELLYPAAPHLLLGGFGCGWCRSRCGRWRRGCGRFSWLRLLFWFLRRFGFASNSHRDHIDHQDHGQKKIDPLLHPTSPPF